MLRRKHEIKKLRRKRSCLFASAPKKNNKKTTTKKKTAKPKRTKEFCSVWAEKLSSSYKSSYICSQEMWLEKPTEERERHVREPL